MRQEGEGRRLEMGRQEDGRKGFESEGRARGEE
jgi:hypothetical protein